MLGVGHAWSRKLHPTENPRPRDGRAGGALGDGVEGRGWGGGGVCG